MSELMKCRIALLTALIGKAPGRRLGRTAVMKLLYFLTAIRNVPLGYHFTLYSYGPFDSAVLGDIDYAARLDALTVETETYPSGYGYVIQPADGSDVVTGWSPDFIQKYQNDIDWVIEEFGSLAASELELLSTIVYVNQEHRLFSMSEIADRVAEIKPRFNHQAIQDRAEKLRDKGILTTAA